MLQEIGTVDRVPEFSKPREGRKNDSFRLMGFGHRVYKNYDPRAKIMQKTCHEVLEEVGHKDDPILQVAMELERIALNDDYFVEKKLYPVSTSVRYYLKALGFPTDMFTVLFAIAAPSAGSHSRRMIGDPRAAHRQAAALCTGHVEHAYVPITAR